MIVARRAGAAALAIVPLLLLVACGDGEDDSPVVSAPATTTTPTGGSTVTTTATSPTTAASGTVVSITVRAGSVEGPSRQRVALNERLTLRVTSDVADEVHVHVYDRRANVTPAAPVELSFVANIPGVFEVELESSHRRLTTLEVQP